MSKDLILERYENTIKDSILSSFESDRVIRISKQDDLEFLQEQEADPVNISNISRNNSDSKRLGRIIATGAKGLSVGAAKQITRRAAQKAFAKKATPFITKALKTFGFGTKAIPLVGSVIALVSLGFNLYQFTRAMTKFTDSLLEHSGVELSGVRSLLGEYSIIDASADDMRKVAEGLRQNLAEEDREVLRAQYYETMEEFKDTVIDLLLTLKDFTLEAGLVAAVAIKLTPAELVAKEILFKGHESMQDIVNSSPEAMQKLFKVLRYVATPFSFVPSLMPVIGFLYDFERVNAFSEIDRIIDTPRDALDHIEDTVGYTARKGAGVYHDVDDAMSDMAKDIAKSIKPSDLMPE